MRTFILVYFELKLMIIFSYTLNLVVWDCLIMYDSAKENKKLALIRFFFSQESKQSFDILNRDIAGHRK